MKRNVRFDDAKRRLDAALEEMAAEPPMAPAAPSTAEAEMTSHDVSPLPPDPAPAPGAEGQPDQPHPTTAARPANFGAPRRLLNRQPAAGAAGLRPAQQTAGPGPAPAQTSEALVRLLIGVAVLGLDALSARAGVWEERAGSGDGTGEPRPNGAAPAGEGRAEARFRHGLIGWIFETEEELRPRGNPLQWLRSVVAHLFSTVFSVVFDSLPRLGRRRARGADPSDQDTARWVERGLAEERRSRAFAAAALEDILGAAIPYLASQQGVQDAIAQLVRSPAMNDAIVTLARRKGVQEAVGHLVRSPMMDDAIVTLAARPGVQDAVAQLVRSPMMDDAIVTLAARPGVQDAVAQLVRTPMMDDAIVALAQREGVQEAVAHLVRSPAMDDAIVTLARRDGVQRAVAELVDSPMIGDAVTKIVRSPAMEDAVTYLVGTPAMTNAIETLSKSPALVQLVQTQSTSIAGEIVEEVRERGVSGDIVVEGFARRLLGRRPRSQLPPDAQGLVVHEGGRPAERGAKR
jgi:hypothetical protein